MMLSPNMIKAAGEMMSQMDPNALNSMMSLAAQMAPPGMAPPPGFDANMAKKAAADLKNLSPDQIAAIQQEALARSTQV